MPQRITKPNLVIQHLAHLAKMVCHRANGRRASSQNEESLLGSLQQPVGDSEYCGVATSPLPEILTSQSQTCAAEFRLSPDDDRSHFTMTAYNLDRTAPSMASFSLTLVSGLLISIMSI